jgi:catechol 2,3-dioxygenase-like lactoylglutathione lyase family enzyme
MRFLKIKHIFIFFLAIITLINIVIVKPLVAQPTKLITQTPQQSTLSAMTMDHVAIRVPNFEETVQWYKDKLGFEELVRWQAPPYVDPDLQFAYLKLNEAIIEIAGGGNPVRHTDPPAAIGDTFSSQGYIHVCLRVNDINAAVKELKQRGVEIFAGPNTNPTLNRSFIHFKDNNGFDVELVQYLQ